MTVCRLAEEFAYQVEGMGLSLSLDFKEFRLRICEATCTMYRAAIERKQMVFPSRIPNAPRGWNEDTERIWEDYITNFHLGYDFWSAFWHTIDVGGWESDISNFRTLIQSILPFYIHREIGLLEDKGLIAKNSEGEYVNPEDDDAYEGGDDYRGDD